MKWLRCYRYNVTFKQWFLRGVSSCQAIGFALKFHLALSEDPMHCIQEKAAVSFINHTVVRHLGKNQAPSFYNLPLRCIRCSPRLRCLAPPPHWLVHIVEIHSHTQEPEVHVRLVSQVSQKEL